MNEPPDIHEGFAARARLGVLGLDLEAMVEVVRRGELARAEATGYDPITAAGTDAYRFRVRALREAYCPKDWRVARPTGLELLVSPDGNLSILTRAGDAGVGLRDADPQPKSDIGGGTCSVLDGNLPLFEPQWLQAQGKRRPERETWMLLVFASPSVVRAELSLGSEAEGGRIARWFERIIFPELDPNDLRPGRTDHSDDSEQSGVPIDVPIIRKKQK